MNGAGGLAGTSAALVLGLLAAGCGPAGARDAARGREIAPDAIVAVTLDTERATFAEFFVDVPADAVSLRWKLVSSRVELDLETSLGEPIDVENEVMDFRVESDLGEATVVYDRFTTPRIGKERCHARVEWPSDVLPRAPDGERLPLRFTIQAAITRARVDGVLTTATPQKGSIELSSGDFRTYTIDVPPGTAVLRFDLVEADSDLDLLVRHGQPILALEDDVRVAEHAYGRETLLVRHDDGSALEPGTWFVDVVDRWRDDRRSAFALRARFDTRPPEEVLAIPAIAPAIGDGPLAKALAAVVELSIDDSTGSGVIVSSDGWILTCAHVVTDIGGARARSVTVALTLESRRPALELFRAEVREIDHERDLALLHVERGFFDQALPNDLVLPSVDVDFAAEPRIGDALFLVGYPSTGGQGQRVTINATRGIVAGFETLDCGVVIKTDAEITGGNSGGAALDAQGRLIGLPASTIENGAGQIGFVHPVQLVPESWRARLAPRSQAK